MKPIKTIAWRKRLARKSAEITFTGISAIASELRALRAEVCAGTSAIALNTKKTERSLERTLDAGLLVRIGDL